MKTANIANLPTAKGEYSPDDEQIMRRAAEQYMASLHNDISDQQNQTSAPSSLALKRFQFLLMGA
jgi:GAF domain-containing protein